MKLKPLVSVVIPVHNAALYLRQCLDCLIHQTLDNIEIILIENGSTDETISILEEYRDQFHEKVFYKSIPPQISAGPGRNEGISMARADYIFICDSDDMMDYRMLELMYQKAISDNCDIVYAPSWDVNENGRSRVTGRISEPMSNEHLILGQTPSFWTKLVHRNLIEKSGKIPININFEDVAYALILSSYATKIGYVDRALYYYFRREGSAINNTFSRRLADTIRAENYALEYCNQKYRDCVMAHIAYRININLRVRWPIADQIIQQLKKYWSEIERNQYVLVNSKLYNNLKRYANLRNDPMPCRVFLNGFSGYPSENFVEQIEKSAFYDVEEILVLNAENCDINENSLVRDAYYKGDLDFVAGYFALKYIYKQGGMYIDRRIHINAPFNYMRYWNAFFARIDTENYSDWVFGGHAGDPTIAEIIKTYDERGFYEERYYPLAARIKNILTAVFCIPMDGKTHLFPFAVSVFAPDVMFCQVVPPSGFAPRLNLCSHDYSQYAGQSGYSTIPTQTLQYLCSQTNNDELANLRRDSQLLKDIMASKSWKMTQIIKTFANSRWGYFPKKVFNGIRLLRRKFKEIEIWVRKQK